MEETSGPHHEFHSAMKNIKSKISLLLSVSSLGSTLVSKCVIGATFLYYYVADIFYLPFIPCTIRIDINGTPCKITVRRISDFWVMKDVLVDREYDVAFEDPKIIIDLGSNIGIAALFFATKYPKAVVHAIEPNPIIFTDLVANTSEFKNIRVYDIAITEKTGKLDLYVGRSGAGSSTSRRSGFRKQYSVRSKTLDDFLRENNIQQVDLLKFDVEGAETAIFRGFNGFKKIRSYVGEIHYDLNDLTPEEIKGKAADYIVTEQYVRQDRSVIQLTYNDREI